MKQLAFILSLIFLALPAQSEEVKFTILATGDTHSHFDAHVHPTHLGGMARLKTAMDTIEEKAKKDNRPVLKLDTGDCSEGSIYFNLGGGVASYKLLNRMNYDAIAFGNHDWYIGVDKLNDILTRVPPNFSFLSANLFWKKAKKDGQAHPLKGKIKPYEVFYLVGNEFLKRGQKGFNPDAEEHKDKDYFKVGVMGMSTNEKAYAFFLDPVIPQNPSRWAYKTALRMKQKEKVDMIVMLSHLLDKDDIEVARDTISLDLIIGGHSHNKVAPVNGKPIVIKHEDEDEKEDTTWIVKTGEFGQFMAQVDITHNNYVRWDKSKYDLHQIDSKYEKNAEIDAFVKEQRGALVEKYRTKNDYGRNIFNDEVVENQVDMFKIGTTESYMGNLLANAIFERAKTWADKEGKPKIDFAVNNSEFISHGLFKGKIHSSMIYDAFPLIYNPLSDRSWTIHIINIKGEELKNAIDMVFELEHFFDVAGMKVVYDLTHSPDKVLKMTHAGGEVEDDKIYRVAASEGIVKAMKLFKDRLLPSATFEDTGVEIWSTLRSYMRQKKVLRADDNDIRVSGRIRTTQPDLVVLSEDISIEPVSADDKKKLRIKVLIRNLGYGGLRHGEVAQAATDPTNVSFYIDKTPENIVDDITVHGHPHTMFWEEYPKPHGKRAFKLSSLMLDDLPGLKKEGKLPSHLELLKTEVIRSLFKSQAVTVETDLNLSSYKTSDRPYTIYVLIDCAEGTGFKDEVVAGSGDKKTVRKKFKDKEMNLHNNKALVYYRLH